MVNEIGNKYGKLTVIARAQKPIDKKSPGAYWLCKCECGNTTIARGADLRAGCINSCGCLYGKHTIVDETGKRYGKLTVIGQVSERKRGAIQWLCQCDCGNKVIVRGADLRVGQVASCGCLIRDKSREANLKDIKGKRFGKLIVLDFDEELSNIKRKPYWKCKCDCGTVISKTTSVLSSGHCHSCGCLKKSWGEEKIENILKENNINYKKEYTLPGLVEENNISLRFDFAILSSSNELIELIEYDGEQHFKAISIWDGEEGLKRRKINDNKKNDYCLKHNIKLIRIPYTYIDNLTINDLGDLNELSQ